MLYSLKYTDEMAESTGGYAKAWFIRIRPKYREDVGIHEHEKVHVWQWWRTLGLHSLLYLCFKSYRLAAEVEAYREQLKHAPATNDPERYRQMYAGFISDPDPVKGYGLKITKEEVLKRL